MLKEYLQNKGIPFKESNGELITKCLFNDCDKDSHGQEAHLYFDAHTSQYHCKKCDSRGNIITLKKHLGDVSVPIQSQNKRNVKTLTPVMVEKYHNDLPQDIVDYLHKREITDDIIAKYKLGYKQEYGTYWITIPIKDVDGNYSFFKLRQDPKFGNEKRMWPASENGAQIFDWETLLMAKEKILIVEGEGDALTVKSRNIDCICGTAGAGTWKESWNEYLRPELEYFVCYDNDDPGRKGALRVAENLFKHGCKKVHIVTLPPEVGDKGDLEDYLVRLKMPIDDIFTKYAEEYPKKIDTRNFTEIHVDFVKEVLESTIKKDDENKIITFLSMLTTYTNEAQINILFNAPSSTGKSHLPISVKDLFPVEDLIVLANCSPTAFFHEQGQYDKEKNQIIVDLSRKILIFTDMPNSALLERLRPMLSHDQKESVMKITDKNQKGGNKTKTVVLVGYPSVYFCTAGLKIDEQETTRFITLSPSIEQDKLTAGIKQSIAKESDREKFLLEVNADPNRELLKERIRAIKQENIVDVKIKDTKLIEDMYLDNKKLVKPRHQRDVKKVISLIKGFTLLNMWFREREGEYVFASEQDIKNGVNLWLRISDGQDYGVSPYVLEIFKEIILPTWQEHKVKALGSGFGVEGISRAEIQEKHRLKYGRAISPLYLRQQILPQMEGAGLISQEQDPLDKRFTLVTPLESEFESETNIVLPHVGVNIDKNEENKPN